MEEELNSDLAKEILIVSAYLGDKYTINISDEILKKLTDLAADSDKDIFIDINKNLSEQNISEECKDWIALLYYQNSNPQVIDELLNE